MKILGWMHQKFRRSSFEAVKDISICNPCTCTCFTELPSLDDRQCYLKPNFDFKSLSNVQREDHPPKSFSSLEAAMAEEEEFEEESSAAHSELFHGFLSIGTLGTDSLGNHPSTPTCSISGENIAEKDIEVIASELKLFNDELEKVLRAEAKDGCILLTGRNSYVSTGRSSHCSTITPSGKQLESTVNNGSGTNVCPLQGYFFGSRIELPETTTARKEHRPSTTAKKEHRPSLGELFQKTKAMEENNEASNDTNDKQTDKDCDKSTLHLVKKILKKRMIGSSLWSSIATDIKLHKILHTFHRKASPDSSTNVKKSSKSTKNWGRKQRHHAFAGTSITSTPHHGLYKESKKYQNSQSDQQKFTHNGDSNSYKECWIRTDAEYLVLEL